VAREGCVKRYRVIYADPPWSYGDRCLHRGGAERHYPTLDLGALSLLRVDRLALPDSALFLWATSPMMPEAITVMRAWGFRYTTVAFVWEKTTGEGAAAMGMGHWTRANAEYVLLGIRGRPKRASASVPQIIRAPRAEHSRKPAEIRRRIDELILGRRIELFARERAPGWDAWGLEVESTKAAVDCLGVPG